MAYADTRKRIHASALTAILTGEDDARRLAARLQQARRRMTSPLAVWESAVAVARVLDLAVRDAADPVAEYLVLAEIDVVAVPPEAARDPLDAFDRYGKGRHPADLNVRDCFAYACARIYRQRLLFKGADFAIPI
jgi:ribonuclease VapC